MSVFALSFPLLPPAVCAALPFFRYFSSRPYLLSPDVSARRRKKTELQSRKWGVGGDEGSLKRGTVGVAAILGFSVRRRKLSGSPDTVTAPELHGNKRMIGSGIKGLIHYLLSYGHFRVCVCSRPARIHLATLLPTAHLGNDADLQQSKRRP